MSSDKAFYVNPINVNGSTFQLDEAESNHAIRVLRLKKGDEICLLDGAGIGYHAKIKSIEKNVSGTIIEVKPDLGENKCSVNLASALMKSSDGQFISGLMGADKSLSELELDNNVTMIIGPEGDFTENEIGQMRNAGVLFFNLGGRRLRAETAALNSLAVLNELMN